jgi:hypothetical protein
MSARSNNTSRHDLSAMYPGVKFEVWRSHHVRLENGLKCKHEAHGLEAREPPWLKSWVNRVTP